MVKKIYVYTQHVDKITTVNLLQKYGYRVNHIWS